MPTDLNKQLGIDDFIKSLDIAIAKTMDLNAAFMELNKTNEETAKTTITVTKAREDSKKVVDDLAKATEGLTVDEIERAKVQDQAIKTGEKLTAVQSEENKLLQKNKIALQQANKEIRDNIKEEIKREQIQDKVTEALNTTANSINEATAQNKILRAAVRDVDVTQEGAAETIETLNSKIDENSEFITDNSDAYVQTKRNIGNYQSALEGLDNPLEVVNVSLAEFSKQAKEQGESFDAVGTASQIAQAGLKTINAQLKALIANPIVAVIAGITAGFLALRNALNSTEEGQRLLAAATGVINGVLTGLSEIVIALVDPLVRLFTDPQKALNDFREAIQSRIFTVFESLQNIALGVGKILTGIWERDLDQIKEGAKESGEAFVDLQRAANPTVIIAEKLASTVADVVDITGRAVKLEQERFDLEKQRNNFLITEAELQRDIAQLRAEAKDLDLDTASRQEAIAKAEELTRQLTQERLAIKKEELRLLIEERGLGADNLEDNREFAQLQADIIKLEEQEANQIKAIRRERQSLNAEAQRSLALQIKLNEQNLEGAIQAQAEFEREQERKATDIEAILKTAELKKSVDTEEQTRAKQNAQQEEALAQQVNNSKQVLAEATGDAQLQVLSNVFDADKQSALKTAVINTSEGVTKAIAKGGLLGIAQGALVAAAGAIEIAKISGINAFYKGTQNAPQGLAWISERGSELIEDRAGNLKLIPDLSLVNMQGGEKVYTHDQTKKMLFNDQGIISAIQKQKQKIIVNVQPESYNSKYRMRV